MPVHNEIDVHAYYDSYQRWGATVLRYCKLFVGDRDRAEAAVQQGFLEFFRRTSNRLNEGDGLPTDLMRAVVDAAKNQCSPFEDNLDTKDLESCIRLLPWEERAVLLLRSTFGLKPEQVADITNTTVDAVNRTWIDAMLRTGKLWVNR